MTDRIKYLKTLSFVLILAITVQLFAFSAAAAEYKITDIALTPGADESQLNFAWYTNTETPRGSVVQIALKSDMAGDEFPEDKAETFAGASSPATAGLASNKVTVRGLENSTEYVYRIGDGSEENWSPVYSYTTYNPDDYGFIFVGDPQIGYKDSNTEKQTWGETLTKAKEKFPEASFVLTAGDQVQKNQISHYNAFFSPEILRSLPVAPVQGNHEAGAQHFSLHFNMPNITEYGETDSGGKDGGYYYCYGDTLFMFLNTNNTNVSEHTALMREATAKYPDAKWKVLMFHHSIYSTTEHYTGAYVQRFINGMVPVIDELGIDLVLMGHDHVYVRTHLMKGNNVQPEAETDENGSLINPDGTFYVTGNSPSGSKYYDIELTDPDFAAVNSQLQVPTFSYVKVSGRQLSFATYRTDTMEEVDSFSIVKNNPVNGFPGLSLDYCGFVRNNEAFDALYSDDTGEISAGAVLSNDSLNEYSFSLIMAEYDSVGKLVSANISAPQILPPYSGEYGGCEKVKANTSSIDASSIEPGNTLKLFIWEGLDSIIPLTEPVQTEKLVDKRPEYDPDTIVYECESLIASTSGGEAVKVSDSQCSAGSYSEFNAAGEDSYIEYIVNFPSSGTWEVSVKAKTAPDGGSFRIYLPQSEKYIGSSDTEQYSPVEEVKTITIGKYSFNSAGDKQLRFIVTGKNDISGGYVLRNDSIIIHKEQ